VAEERETPDPFEDELRSFQPVEPSRRLLDSVARELPGRPGSSIPRRLFIGAAAALAACVLVAAGVWRAAHPTDVRDPGPVGLATVPASSPSGTDDDDDNRPSMASYRRALSRSPAAVDEMLDRHAARLLPREPYGAAAAVTVRVTPSSGLESLR
jgi:hypothetical protein